MHADALSHTREKQYTAGLATLHTFAVYRGPDFRLSWRLFFHRMIDMTGAPPPAARSIGSWCQVLVALATAVGLCMPANVAAQSDSGALMRDLQADLAALAVAARAGAASATGSTGPASISRLRELLTRVRAADLLLEEHHRALEDRLQRGGVSAAVLARHQDNGRIFRERIDRLYAAATPLSADADNPIVAAQLRAALNAIAEALADAGDSSARTPIGASLPYRSLALPQLAPQLGAPITPAYLSTPVPAPQAADLAETPDTEFSAAIRAQAAALGQDSIAIFEFVQNNVRSEFYYGAMKDASETLRQLSGNDTDQASLLIALLRASGVPARYVRGVIRLSGPQAMSWTGAGSTRRAAEIFTRAGIPFRPILQGGGIGGFEIEHTWVEAYVPYSNYRGARLGTIGRAWIPLDPSFKALDVAAGEDVLSAMGFSASTLVPEYLSQTQAQAPMDFYRSAIDDYLTQAGSALTFEQVLSTRTIRAVQSGLLPSTLPYGIVSINEEGAAVADWLRHRVRFVAEGEGGTSFDVTVPAADLAGQRLTLSYVPATVEDQVAAHSFLGLDNTPAYLVKLRPVLKIGGVVKAAGTTPIQMGAFHSLTVEIQTPRGAVPVVNSMLAGGYYAIGLATQPAAYDMPLARAPDDTEHRAADRLYSIAIDYIRRWNEVERTLEGLLRVVNVRPALSHVIVGTVHARTVVFGQPQSIDWRGVFVDADLRVAEPVPTGADNTRAPEFMRLSGLAGSVLEADVLRLNLNVDAVSAASVIQLAREGAIPIEDVTSANLQEVLSRLETAGVVRDDVADAVNQGWRVTIPQRDLTRHIWTGIGYVMIDPATGAGGYFISGALAGGISVLPPADWPDQPIAEELSGPNAEPPNTDPASVRFLTKVAITDRQKGVVGQPLEQPLKVWARDGEGRPVKDARVTFIAQSGGGRFEDGDTYTTTTNHLGIATAPYRLGQSTAQQPFFVRANAGDAHVTQVGQNVITAAVISNAGPVLLAAPFEQFAYPGPPVRIVKVLGDLSGTLEPGVFGGSVLARVEDEFENPVSNAAVRFTVLPAQPVLPSAAFPPPGAVNLHIYPHEPPCAVATPVLGDCGAVAEFLDATTSSSGAAVNTILGNTAGTTFSVQASIPSHAQVPAQTFQLQSRTARAFGVGRYYAPELILMLPGLVGAGGQPINAARAGSALARPLEALLMLREDEYVLEPTGQECPNPEDFCYRIRSLETSRIRPIDVSASGLVTFAGVGNATVTAPRSFETASVLFTPAAGIEATTTPAVNTASGRYASTVTVALVPAANTINVNATATVWAPCFNLHTGIVTPMPLTLAAGQNAWADSMFFPRLSSDVASCVSSGVVAAAGAANTPTHVVFGVTGRVDEVSLPVSTEGLTLDAHSIGYQIQPAAYVASVADVDLFEIDGSGETWKGALTGSTLSATGTASLLQGTAFDLTKTYETQLVLNRGTEVEIRSPRARLSVVNPVDLTLSALERAVVKTYLDRTNQTSCESPAALTFSLSDEARVTIRVDGNVLRTSGTTGSVDWSGVTLAGGDHVVPITASSVSLPGIHLFSIEATFARPDGTEVVRTADGFIQHDVIINAFLPIGHTLVKGVDLADGHLSLVREDLTIPGHGPTLQFTRSYGSSGNRASGVMGAGWTHNYDARVVKDSCGTVTLVGGEGSGIKFSQPTPGIDPQGNLIETYRPQAGYYGRLILNVADGSYDYVTKHGVRHHYERDFTPGDVFDNRLSFIEDSNGNRLTLRYEAATPFNLETVTDASGRTLRFTYEPFGLVPENRLTRIDGPLALVVIYAYDEFGNLKTASRDVKTERYEYTVTNAQDRHNLIRVIGANHGVTGPNADVMQVSYFTEQDEIPGWVDNLQLFAAKNEMVRSITDGVNTPQAATHQFAYDYSSRATGFVITVVDPREVSTRYTIDPGFGAVLEKRVQIPGGDSVTITRWAFQDGINDIFITRTIDPNGRVINYSYDANGNPHAEAVALTTVSYEPVTNSAGIPVETVGRQSTYEPVFGRITEEVDAESRITRHQLDSANGNTLSTTLDARDGSPPIVTRYTYDNVGPLRGLVKTITDPRGQITTYSYDAYGNEATVVDPVGNTTTKIFDARSRLREMYDTFGHRTTYDYDALDRVIVETRTTWAQPADLAMASAADRRTVTTYFPGGQPRTVTSATEHVTTFEYDALNRQSRQLDTVIDADGVATTLSIETTWDGNGNKTFERDRRGFSQVQIYDPLNRVIETVREGQVTAKYTYDAAGNRLSETDLHGHVTRFVLDGLYRVVRTVLPLAPYATSSRYDLVGNVLTETDANGHSTHMTYDGLNRLTSTTDALGSVKRIHYDAAGNRIVEEDQTVGLVTRYDDFDGRNRPAAMRQQFTDPLTGQLTTYTTLFAYLDAENAKVTTSPRGVVTRERFNGHDVLIERIDDVGGLDLVTTFRYDGNGNLTGEKDAEGAGIDKQFTFDGLNRRLSATYQLGGSERWFYDGNGNITRSFDRRGIERTFEYDHLDRNIRQGLVESISNGGAMLTLTTVVHDDAGNATVTTDANENTTRQELDALHRASRVVDALGVEILTEWDGVNQIAEIDKLGIRTEVDYDAINRSIEQRIIDGEQVFVQQTQYLDGLSRTVSTDLHLTTEPNFGRTITQLDALQRVRRTIRAHPGLPARYGVAELILDERTYDAHDNVTRLADANGNVTLTQYDGADRPVRVTEGGESSVAADTTYVYDRADNIVESKDGRPHTQRFDVKHFYDARYRKVMSQTGAGEITVYTYDQNDNLVTFTEPKGGAHITIYGYDELNQVLWVDETRGGAGGVTHYRYDANRNQIAKQDATGNLTTFRYDALNRQTDMFQHRAPGALERERARDAGPGGDEGTAQHWRFGFDANGNQTLTIDAADQRVDMAYDSMDRLISRTYSAHQPDAAGNPVFPRPTRIAYRYDGNGNQLRVDETKDVSASQTVVETSTMEYDGLNRLVSRTNYDGKTVGFEYDRGGNRRTVIDADGVRTEYAFDARNRLTTATEAGLQTRYAYWPDGLQRTVTYPNGIVSELTYDTADRLVQIVNHSGDPGSPVSRYDYTYDANGNRSTQIERHARLNGGASQQTSYMYDAANRLTSVDYPGQARMAYSYAPNGNRLSESGTAPVNEAAVARAYAYNRLNQLTSISDAANPESSISLRYDRNGNTSEHRVGLLDPTTGDVTAPTSVKRFAWNIRDYLARSDGATGPVTFDYDHEGRRVKTIAPVFHTRYLYDLVNVLQEYDGTALTTTLKYSYGPTGLLSLNAGANGKSFYLRDAVGSTSELIDSIGETRASYSYDPWGKVLASFDTTPNRHRFTGQISDPETGLQYFGARYYDETIGRFLSQDEYLGDANDPASQHRYVYALANPFRFIDPSGFQNVEAGSGFGPGNPCQGVPVTEACNPATKEVDDTLKQINEQYEARIRREGQQLAEQVEQLYETRKSVYRNLNTYQRAHQLAETIKREELLARLEAVEGGGISELATFLGEQVASADPDSLAGAGLGALLHSVGTVASFFEPSGTVNVTWKLNQGQDVTLYDAAGVGLDAVLLLAPAAASKLNGARQVAMASWKNTAGKAFNRRVKAVLEEVLPVNPLDSKSQRFYQQAADRLGVDVAFRAVDPITKGVTTAMGWLPNIRPKPAGNIGKSIFGYINTSKGRFRADADVLFVKDRLTGKIWDNARVMRELVSPTNRAIRAAGGKTLVAHGSHFSAYVAAGGPLKTLDKLAKIGDPGGAIVMGRNAGRYISQTTGRAIGMGSGRWHLAWDRKFPYPKFSSGAPMPAPFMGPYPAGRAVSEHAQRK